MKIKMKQLLEETGISRRTYSHYRKFGIIKDSEVADNRTPKNEILVDANLIDKIKRVQKMMKDGRKFWDVVDFYNPVFFNGIVFIPHPQNKAYYKLELSRQFVEDYTMKIWIDEKFIEVIKNLISVNNFHILPESIKYIDKDKLLKRLFLKIPTTNILFESGGHLNILIEIQDDMEYSFREEWSEVEKRMRNKKWPTCLKRP